MRSSRLVDEARRGIAIWCLLRSWALTNTESISSSRIPKMKSPTTRLETRKMSSSTIRAPDSRCGYAVTAGVSIRSSSLLAVRLWWSSADALMGWWGSSSVTISYIVLLVLLGFMATADVWLGPILTRDWTIHLVHTVFNCRNELFNDYLLQFDFTIPARIPAFTNKIITMNYGRWRQSPALNAMRLLRVRKFDQVNSLPPFARRYDPNVY